VVDAGRAFAFERSEVGGGTIEWRYTFESEGTGTLVTESYTVLKPVNTLGWFIIDTLASLKDRKGDLRRGMTENLERDLPGGDHAQINASEGSRRLKCA
jgi:hypothetical protein